MRKAAQRVRDVVLGMLRIHARRKTKEAYWDKAYAEGKWAMLDETSGDIVYSLIEKWAHGGSILDLGCGSGNTANELEPGAYEKYTGVDISSIAIEKALSRSASSDRSDKVRYVQSDILTYVPDEEFDVILFRESIYYIAANKIRPVLMRYAKYLGKKGVFIVRVWDPGRYGKIMDLLETHFEIVDTKASTTSSSLVLAFRPRAQS